MLLCNMLIPATMYFAGKMMRDNPPERINGFYGYRTSMSRKNRDTWAFAHDHAGKLWVKIGRIMLVVTVAAHIPLYFTENEDTLSIISLIIVGLQLTALLASIIPTEKALKENFNADGTRKHD